MKKAQPLRPTRCLFVVALVLAAGPALPQGDPLGPEFRINTYTTSSQNAPSVASDPSGNFVVVWAGNGPGEDLYGGIFGQRFAASGAPVGPEFHVNTYTTSGQTRPVVSADSAGGFIVVWETPDGAGVGVSGQRYSSSGAPLGPEFRANTFTTSNQVLPGVAADPSGNFLIVWYNSPSLDVFGQRYASSGVPLGPEFRVNTSATSLVPSVAADTSGNFVVVWYAAPTGLADVFGQRYAGSGAPLGPEFRVNTYTTNDQAWASVAADAAGGFVVVWYSVNQDSVGDDVFGQRFSGSGVPLGPEFRVNSYTTNNQLTPEIEVDPAGNFVVVWWSVGQDGSLDGVFGQRFASSGSRLGPEFRVNTYTTGGQFPWSVAADAAGNFVVTWNSNGQDGSASGVFGQRYNMILPVELMHFRVE